MGLKQRIFVTRLLPAQHPWRNLLEQFGLEVLAHSMLDFELLDFVSLPKADWIFAYSRTGIEAIARMELDLSQYRIAALGPGTAEEWRDSGFKVDFEGSGHPEQTAERFWEDCLRDHAGGRPSVLFVQAQNSRRSVEKWLGDRIQAKQVVVYRNQIDPKADVPITELVLLTSPLNAEAVITRLNGRKTQPRIWAIGHPTSNYVKAQGLPVEKTLDGLNLQAALEEHFANPKS